MSKSFTLCLLFSVNFLSYFAQNVAINATGASADASAILDISSTNKGILIPRIALTAKNSALPITSPANSLLVFNTATASSGLTLVTPGYYYWNGSLWVRLIPDFEAWSLIGNSGTNSTVNFVGTTDNKPLMFRTNNVEKLRLSVKGQIEPLNTGSSVFLGELAGSNDDLSNNSNVYVGYQANQPNASSEHNVALGYSADVGTIGYNTAVGYQSYAGNSFATAIGYTAYSSGDNAIAIGYTADAQNSSAIAIGNDPFVNGVSAIGIGTLANSQAQNAISIGKNSYTIQPQAIAIGQIADAQGLNSISLGYDTYTVNDNTIAIGNNAEGHGDQGISIGNGTRCFQGNSIAIGNSSVANGNNSIALGNGSNLFTANTVRIGNASVTSIGGQVGWTTISDARFKTNIQENVPGLPFILALRPVSYNLNPNLFNDFIGLPDSTRDLIAEENKAKQVYSGFIAQEVEQTAKKIGYNFSGIDAPKSEGDYYGLRYAEFVVPLVKSVQEQQLQIESMNAELDVLIKENEELKQKLKQK